MNVNELNAWIETEEGKAWADALKKPLADKRTELLSELTKGNARSAEALQRKADAEKLLGDERAAIKKLVLDDQLDRLLSEARVPSLIRPSVTAAILSANDVGLEADGLERRAVVKVKDEAGKEQSVALDAWVRDTWAKSNEAREVCLVPPSSGGGAQGGGGTAAPSVSLANIKNMSAEEILANLPALTKG